MTTLLPRLRHRLQHLLRASGVVVASWADALDRDSLGPYALGPGEASEDVDTVPPRPAHLADAPDHWYRLVAAHAPGLLADRPGASPQTEPPIARAAAPILDADPTSRTAPVPARDEGAGAPPRPPRPGVNALVHAPAVRADAGSGEPSPRHESAGAEPQAGADVPRGGPDPTSARVRQAPPTQPLNVAEPSDRTVFVDVAEPVDGAVRSPYPSSPPPIVPVTPQHRPATGMSPPGAMRPRLVPVRPAAATEVSPFATPPRSGAHRAVSAREAPETPPDGPLDEVELLAPTETTAPMHTASPQEAWIEGSVARPGWPGVPDARGAGPGQASKPASRNRTQELLMAWRDEMDEAQEELGWTASCSS